MTAPTGSPVEVPDEVRPPAYRLAPQVTRLRGYLLAPLVLGVAGGIAWLAQVAKWRVDQGGRHVANPPCLSQGNPCPQPAL